MICHRTGLKPVVHLISVVAAIAIGLGGMSASRTAHADGSGFFVNKLGHILTSHHVTAGCKEIFTAIGKRHVPVQLVSVDPVNDLALLLLPRDQTRSLQTFAVFPPAKTMVRRGESVIAIGFPLPGLLAAQANVTIGSVSANAGPGDDQRFLQISTPIQSGSSGGPLLDKFGRVVGMVFAKLDALSLASIYGDIPQNINFAIKGSVIRRFLVQHHVPFHVRRDSPSRGYSNADIGEHASSFTLYVTCRANKQTPTTIEGKRNPIPFVERRHDALEATSLSRSGQWSVQIGAFRDISLAGQALDHAARVIPNAPDSVRSAEARILPLQRDTGIVYRARLVGLDKVTAQASCNALKSRSMACMVIQE